jgi:hypothetical protein
LVDTDYQAVAFRKGSKAFQSDIYMYEAPHWAVVPLEAISNATVPWETLGAPLILDQIKNIPAQTRRAGAQTKVGSDTFI